MNHFYPSELEFLRKFIENNINRMCAIWKRDGFIYLGIVIALIVLKIVLTIYKNKKENKEFELEESSVKENKEPLKNEESEKETTEEKIKESQE